MHHTGISQNLQVWGGVANLSRDEAKTSQVERWTRRAANRNQRPSRHANLLLTSPYLVTALHRCDEDDADAVHFFISTVLHFPGQLLPNRRTMRFLTAVACLTASVSAFTAMAPRGMAPKKAIGVAHFET